MIIIVIFMIVGGWLVFSFFAGLAVYLFAMTTNHATVEPKKMMESENRSVLNAHTKDSTIMDPLNAAKAAWLKKRNDGAFEVLTVKSRDGLALAGYYCSADASISIGEKTVILVHGMMDSAAGMAYLFDEYLQRGWNVLSVDLRSHGESEGTKRTMGVREGEDLETWVDFLLLRHRVQELYLHGVSMGAVTVLSYVARSRRLPCEIKGVIADSCFASYRATLVRLLTFSVGNKFIARSIVSGVSLSCFLNTGVLFGQMETRKILRNVSVPMLFFHGQKDVLIPLVSMREIFGDVLKRGHEIVVIPSAPHIGTYFYAPSLYMAKISDFSGRKR